MRRSYIGTPKSISFATIERNGYTLSSSQYKELLIPNTTLVSVREFLDRPLKRSDLGSEVGSVNYIPKSSHHFLRTKALQSHSFLPEITSETTVPIRPSAFVQMNLREGDLIISKDSNIGESVILDRDYPNFMTSGALYRLPVTRRKLYLLAFLNHALFRDQIDFMVPKGSTIRHAKTLFLDCKIPLPNYDETNTIRYVEALTQAIISKEQLIRFRHESILTSIDSELRSQQKDNEFLYKFPSISEVDSYGRLDTGLFNRNFASNNFLVTNYIHGSSNLLDRGFDWARGTSLEKNFIGSRIDSDSYRNGFYELILPTNISKYGFVEKSTFIGTATRLKTIARGDIIFGGEGFGKGRTFVVCEPVENTATNYHGIRIFNKNSDLIESIFVRCFLAYWRSLGMIDYIGVGGSGGHCAPSYFHLIETPHFPRAKQEEIARLYYSATQYSAQHCELDNFLSYDSTFNHGAGIFELHKTAKALRLRLNDTLDDIINNRRVSLTFEF